MSGKCVLIGTFRGQKLTKELIAGTRVAFIFTALGLWGRAILAEITSAFVVIETQSWMQFLFLQSWLTLL